MKSNLFFLLIACVGVSFTIIVICNGPVVNGILSITPYENCKELHDNYDKVKSSLNKEQKKIALRPIHKCERDKAMYGLEYASLIMDIFFGFVCALLGLLNYFGAAKSFEKIIGLIGLISGVICFIMTLIYICYSGYIFTNDSDGTIKLDKDNVFAEYNSAKGKYDCKYFDENDINSVSAKYNELGKKQYNYKKDYYFINGKPEISGCYYDDSNFNYNSENVFYYCSSSLLSLFTNGLKTYTENGQIKSCTKLYYNIKNEDIKNKYKYERWVTSIIFGVFVIACNIGLALFGFLIFKDGGSSSHTPL